MTATKASDATFEAEVLQDGLVIVDFWAEWCGPCKALSPLLDQLSEEFRVVKVNIGESPKAMAKYGIRAIPTLMAFKDGRVVDTRVGSMSKALLAE